MDDSELIERFQAGDETAFDELVGRYRRQVYRVARGILRSHEQADEAAQDALLKAHSGLKSFKGESTFKTWMYRIAMNAAFDLRSREMTQARARQGAAAEALTDARVPRGPRALDDLIRAQELGRVREAVARLPERQRLTLTLRVQDDLKLGEIAEILACPVGTVKANLHHAVENLKRQLAEPVAGAGTAATPAAALRRTS